MEREKNPKTTYELFAVFFENACKKAKVRESIYRFPKVTKEIENGWILEIAQLSKHNYSVRLNNTDLNRVDPNEIAFNFDENELFMTKSGVSRMEKQPPEDSKTLMEWARDRYEDGRYILPVIGLE